MAHGSSSARSEFYEPLQHRPFREREERPKTAGCSDCGNVPVRLISDGVRGYVHRLRQAPVRWLWSLTLAQQFILASSTLVLVGLGAVGLGLSGEINKEIRGHVGATALHMERIIAPLVQGLEPNQTIPDETAEAIDLAISQDAPRLGIVVAKIWSPYGHLVYASDQKSVGVLFAPTRALRRALQGRISVQSGSPQPHHGAPPGESMERSTSPSFKLEMGR